METHVEEEINLSEIYAILKRHILKIMIGALVAAILVFTYSTFFISKDYVSSGTMIVNNRKTDSGNITNDEINSAKGLTSVYSIIIKSDPILNKVIQNLKLDMTPGQLNSMITVNSVDATQVMKLSVKSKNPELSAKIVNELLDVAPAEIVEKVEAGSVKIISPAVPNKVAVAPNAKRNALLVAVVVAMGMAGVYILIELLDKSLKSQQDIENLLGYPVIGVIPSTDSVKGASK